MKNSKVINDQEEKGIGWPEIDGGVFCTKGRAPRTSRSVFSRKLKITVAPSEWGVGDNRCWCC